MNTLETTSLIIGITCLILIIVIVLLQKLKVSEDTSKWTSVHAQNALKKNRKELEKLHEQERLIGEKILELKRKRIEILTIIENEKSRA